MLFWRVLRLLFLLVALPAACLLVIRFQHLLALLILIAFYALIFGHHLKRQPLQSA